MNNNNHNHNHISKVTMCGGKVCRAQCIPDYVNNKSAVHTQFCAVLCTPYHSLLLARMLLGHHHNINNNNDSMKSSWANSGSLLLFNFASVVSLCDAILKRHNVYNVLVDNLVACLGPNLMVDLGGTPHAQK